MPRSRNKNQCADSSPAARAAPIPVSYTHLDVYKRQHGDCAATYACGEISEEAKKLIQVTQQSFWEGIKMARSGCRCLLYTSRCV